MALITAERDEARQDASQLRGDVEQANAAAAAQIAAADAARAETVRTREDLTSARAETQAARELARAAETESGDLRTTAGLACPRRTHRCPCRHRRGENPRHPARPGRP